LEDVNVAVKKIAAAKILLFWGLQKNRICGAVRVWAIAQKKSRTLDGTKIRDDLVFYKMKG
jgi:hypothetical protein